MMPTMEASYQQFGGGDPDDSEETPQEFGAMIHIVPESGKSARWNHVEDLDSFFTRNYLYHQKHGFKCMMLQEVLELVQFIFVVVFSTFLFNCVDYQILFRNKESNQTVNQRKIALSDAIVPSDQCLANVSMMWWLVVFVSVVFWLIRAIRVVYHLFQYWNIKAFFNSALRIQDAELDNVTWHEVQKRIREVQLEQQMCIHKKDLTELDIYHRILRFKNYVVAMVNKSLLPVRFNLPLLGSVIYFTHGLKFNINFLLFWGPWSPFQNNWHLKDDYKKANKRQELAQQLSKHIVYVAAANLALCPLILLWQILYSFFNYTEAIKREPGSLGSRCWSQYGRLYLRHFNELDHELNARLNRAYRPASKYMNIFTSPGMTIIAKNIVFVAGAVLAVLLALTVYDEDVLTVEHVLTAITVLGAIIATFRVFIPDENLVWCPENLMTAVLAQVHYLPDNWRGNAHTSRVRNELSQLFQYKATYLLGELLSPMVTPLVLFFYLRPRALDIVDFFRNFTVEVVGVGDVCSFAQMDVRRHGNPAWQTNMPPAPPTTTTATTQLPNQYNQAEDGKTELSLIHFTVTNPEWRPPTDAETFVSALRTQARREAVAPGTQLLINDNSLSSLGVGLSEMLMRPGTVPSVPAPSPLSPSNTIHMRTSRAEGPIHNPQGSCHEQSLGGSVMPETDPMTDMSLSTLYLHEVHYRQMRRRGYHEGSVWLRGGPSSSRTQERTPLIPRPS
ncbi:autophagy-related protein 9A [Macrosteles quadrilineatus]|uniref:autophagy-related protein 9A n=1 Tax=Macrosteles quadrilineatus TaxID=74068 RepID=UPI0023E33680|nr:autophagy-related protein 9A [Macrosteles quadrilineatus]